MGPLEPLAGPSSSWGLPNSGVLCCATELQPQSLGPADALPTVSTRGSVAAGWEHDQGPRGKGRRLYSYSFSPQVSRVPAACSHSSCWTEASPPRSWGCGTVWVPWPAPLLARPWGGPCCPDTGEPSQPVPLTCSPHLPKPLTCPVSPPQEAASPAEVSTSVPSWRPCLPDHSALLLGHPVGQAGPWHSPER